MRYMTREGGAGWEEGEHMVDVEHRTRCDENSSPSVHSSVDIRQKGLH